MLSQGAVFEERDLAKSPLSEGELVELIGDRDIVPFLNTRNDLYRQRNMKNKPPSKAEAVRLMVSEPNLIKRPLLVKDDQILFGFEEEKVKDFLSW